MTQPNPLTDNMSYSDIIKYYLQQWGLDSLASLVDQLGRTGAGNDEISLRLQQSPEWHARFQGNGIRIANGLPPLDPATYLATEAGYRQVLSQLPPGFYDTDAHLANWIGGDVSPNELADRVAMANQVYTNGSAGVKQAWQQYYGGAGNAVAAILDTKTAEPLIQQQVTAAQIGGAALDQGLQLTSNATAVKAAQQGVTLDQARQAYQQIAARVGTDTQLANRYQMTFGQGEEEKANLLGDAGAQNLQQNLYAMENAQFSRAGGANVSSGNPGANY